MLLMRKLACQQLTALCVAALAALLPSLVAFGDDQEKSEPSAAHVEVDLLSDDLADTSPDAPASTDAVPQDDDAALDTKAAADRPDDQSPPGQVPSANKKQSPNKSDSELLESLEKGDSLDDELLEGLSPPPGGDDPAGASASDSEAADSGDPLTKISRQMREVESLLEEAQRLDESCQKQGEIVEELEKLLRDLMRRRQQSSSRSRSKTGQQKTAARGKVQQPQNGPGQPKQGANPGQSPASDSSNQLRQTREEKEEAARLRSLLLKDVWGQLPERLRNQMTQPAGEEFLPEFELLIEDYFKALVRPESERDSP